ncbi:M4 family metallopeptidase [Catenuloplanes indicus]|uniref:Zn-dependent metalloprotease n=1 Tax=Catenuloplanes indicus TaxID=137267 RepID=A0AAE3VYN8_9ACTN|nr:M4 family metallopeptidase [Catenuloplanes indicus]MDQ0365380.1 Zn-dependent metalloprotease [Catenuloplanes indicus]
MRSALALAGVTLLAGSGLAVVATSASAAPAPDPSAGASRALVTHAAAIKGSARDRYTVYSSKTDRTGGAVVRYTRTYAGLRVSGGDVIIRTDARGDYTGSSAGLAAPLTLGTTPAVTAGRAKQAAIDAFEGTVRETAAPELFVDASDGTGRLAWETVLTGFGADGQTPSRLHVITDARTGAGIRSFDEFKTVTGEGHGVYSGEVEIDTTQSGSTFSMIDPERGNGRTCDMNNTTGGTCVTFTDADNVWGDGTQSNRQSAGVDAHIGAATTFDYFLEVHGRNGIFGDGRGVPSLVHYGNNYANAGWDGQQMIYGDGQGNARPLVSLDVAGHEMSHGVTENVVPGDLTYAGESGGLNEATSDIFGNMVEFYANTPGDPGDYDIGEMVDIRGNGTPLRYMYNPPLDGASHGCWSTGTAGINVHYSSGVANHFYFNLAEGSGVTPYGTSPVCGSAPAVTGIGRTKAEQIWFRALDVYFVSNTRYVNPATPSNTARAYTLSAAADLYGFCGTEYRAVQAAWTSVNVAGPDADNCVTNNFTVALDPAAVTADPGGSATTTINTTDVAGTPEEVVLSAGALPAGVTVSFSAASVPAGGSAEVTVNVSDTAGSGTYPITIVGTSPSVARSATLSLTVGVLPGCSASVVAGLPVLDNSTVESRIAISGCAATPSTAAQVGVDITHTWKGDLIVTLLAPDGTAYVLHDRTGGSTDDIVATFPVNLSAETANGTWTLRVRDAANGDTGRLNRWSLTL